MTFTIDAPTPIGSDIEMECDERDVVPVLLGTTVATFHDITAGYNHKQYDSHVINSIHRTQEDGSPYMVDPSQLSQDIEIHADNCYSLSVSAITAHGEYPDDDYILSMLVDDIYRTRYSFAEELQEPIDRRHEEFSYE